MPERIIGILGGMGPEATADLFLHIIRLTPARRDQDHIPVLIYSNSTIPDRTHAIMEGGPDPLPGLIETAKVLEGGGAGILAIPCNAAHYYIQDIQSAVRIAVLNMVEETCRRLKIQIPEIRTVGLLAATGTIRSGVYRRYCEAEGLNLLVPDAAEQERVQAAIAEVKAGVHNQATSSVFETTGRGLADRGAEAVILGCTEIPLAFDPAGASCLSINPTKVLAQAAVDWALGRRA